MKSPAMRLPAAALCAALLSAVAAAAPSMPMGFEAERRDESGKTWRATGNLQQPFAMACVTLRASMLGQGYQLVHDISGEEASARRLHLWRRGDEEVIVMLWQKDLYSTGLAWGLSSPEDEEDGEEDGEEAEGEADEVGPEPSADSGKAGIPKPHVPGESAAAAATAPADEPEAAEMNTDP